VGFGWPAKVHAIGSSGGPGQGWETRVSNGQGGGSGISGATGQFECGAKPQWHFRARQGTKQMQF